MAKVTDEWGEWEETTHSSGVKSRILVKASQKQKDYLKAQPKPKKLYFIVKKETIGSNEIEVSRSYPVELKTAEITALKAKNYIIEEQ